MEGQGQRTLYFKDAKISSQGKRPWRDPRPPGRGERPGCSFKPLMTPPLPQPTWGTQRGVLARLAGLPLTPSCAQLYTLCFLREQWEMVAFVSSPQPFCGHLTGENHGLFPAPGVTPQLAQYWAQSRPSAEMPGIGLISLSLGLREVGHVWAEKTSSLTGGKREVARDQQRASGTQTSGVPGLHLPVPHTAVDSGASQSPHFLSSTSRAAGEGET